MSFVVMAVAGEYSDRSHWTVAVCSTKASADSFADEAQKWADGEAALPSPFDAQLGMGYRGDVVYEVVETPDVA